MDLLSKLGIDWKLLSAQLVQFVALLFILRWLAYKPLLRLLEKRSMMIAKSLEDAKAVERSVAATQLDRERVLHEARKEANAVLAEAKQSAEQLKATMLDDAQRSLAAMRQRAEADAMQLKTRMLNEAKTELAHLVVEASGKVLGKTIDVKIDDVLVENALQEVQQ